MHALNLCLAVLCCAVLAGVMTLPEKVVSTAAEHFSVVALGFMTTLILIHVLRCAVLCHAVLASDSLYLAASYDLLRPHTV